MHRLWWFVGVVVFCSKAWCMVVVISLMVCLMLLFGCLLCVWLWWCCWFVGLLELLFVVNSVGHCVSLSLDFMF